MNPTQRVQRAIEDIRAGKMIILVDDEDRENEGDLCMAANKVTPEAINFMAIHGRGLICLTLTEQRCQELALPMMVHDHDNQTPYGTAFTVSIDARDGISTGISAHDRALTIQKTIDSKTRPEELVRPGHIFPLRARNGGVLVRAGQTEGSVDLARLAGLHPSGVICEIMKDDGTMARMPDLEEFADRHNLHIVSIADLIEYRLQNESFVERLKEVELVLHDQIRYRAVVYRDRLKGHTHMALCLGEWTPEETVLVRVHRNNIMGDVFGFNTADGPPNIRHVLNVLEHEGKGVLLYLNTRDEHADLFHSLLTYAEKQQFPSPPMDLREYGMGAQMLADLGLHKICLLTNSPKRLAGIEGFGIHIVEQQSMEQTFATMSPSQLRMVQHVALQES